MFLRKLKAAILMCFFLLLLLIAFPGKIGNQIEVLLILSPILSAYVIGSSYLIDRIRVKAKMHISAFPMYLIFGFLFGPIISVLFWEFDSIMVFTPLGLAITLFFYLSYYHILKK